MDLQLNLEDDEVEYIESVGIMEGVTDTLERALRHVVQVKSADPLLTLSEEISALNSHNRTLVKGLPVNCCPSVSLTVGPVIGEVYKQYQRILWDPSVQEDRHSKMPAQDDYFQEFHYHVYGPIGIFLFDMRGNRITGDGV